MSPKTSSSKNKIKNEKTDPRRPQITWTQVVFGLFALMIITVMILSLVVQQN